MTCTTAGLLMVAGFATMFVGAGSVPLLVVGVLLLDAGAGLSHAANQSSAFALRPDARGRINSVCMSGYFIGGAIGTLFAATALATGGCSAVCLLGIVIAAAMPLAEWLQPIPDPGAELAR